MTNTRQEILDSWTNLKELIYLNKRNEQEQVIFNALKDFDLDELGTILFDDHKRHQKQEDLEKELKELSEREITNYDRLLNIREEFLRVQLKDFNELRDDYIKIKKHLFFTYVSLSIFQELKERLEEKEKEVVKLKEENKKLGIQARSLVQLKERLKKFENLEEEKEALEELVKAQTEMLKPLWLIDRGIDSYKKEYEEEPSKELVEWYNRIEKAFELLEKEEASKKG